MVTRRITSSAVFVAALVLLAFAARPAYAQWKVVGTFPTAIGCGFFFDENHGLIGSGVRWTAFPTDPQDPCAIYKTTDGGQTWAPCTVPTVINGAVSSIWMQNAAIGYASIFPSVVYSDNNTFGGSSLWKTTDGGNTWFDPYHVDHAMSSVYGQNGLIVFTIWDNSEFSNITPPDMSGGDFSFDGGRTWQQSNFRRGNGIAFSDSLNGVVTEMNPNAGGANHWYTMDAGRSWRSTSTDQYEAWSVYAPPGKRMYFTANESQAGLDRKYINWSTDGGVKWAQRYAFPYIQFTGTIAGVDSTLYIQTDTGASATVFNRGIYRSDDLGATWHWVGGPAHSRDTRFVVTGCHGGIVYAFDPYGKVWKTTDGGDGTIGATHLVFPGIPAGNGVFGFPPGQDCNPLIGHIQYSVNGCTASGSLDSAWMTGSPAFTLTDPRAMPRTVSADSVFVAYSPSGVPAGVTAQNDTAFLHLRYDLQGKTVDTTLVLVGWGPNLTLQNMSLQRLAVRAAAFGQTIDMPLVEALNPASVDSLRLSGLRAINMSLTFDSSRLAFVSYAPPAGLSTVSVNARAGAVDIFTQNSSWTPSEGGLDMGTARFQILSRRGGSSLITLSDLAMLTGKGASVHPCLGTQEDHVWQVEIISTADVKPASEISGLSFAPSPFADHISVANSGTRTISLTLCDLLGRTVSTYNAPPSSHAEWTTSDIRPGMYIILWQENGTIRSARLTKVE